MRVTSSKWLEPAPMAQQSRLRTPSPTRREEGVFLCYCVFADFAATAAAAQPSDSLRYTGELMGRVFDWPSAIRVTIADLRTGRDND